ncbi:hypothetical protein [Streptomyces sp. TP-A0874]|uniref:hypothetical protein n=1 Tax=Streptomyces sp. TP-A0874 TaxID=549819 RepID=UPI000AF1CD20|nr:hypothetical protein [Streptomyces sp. TP-A0874]
MIDAARRLAGQTRLPTVLGLTDGLLNALTLASSSLLGTGSPATLSLAARVGCVALVTSAFTMFVADYAEQRAHLVRAAKELNLISRGHLATTRLGQLAAMRSTRAMAVAAVSSFVGAGLPLLLGVLIPGPSWIVILLAIAALSALGASLAHAFQGRKGRWALAMGCGAVAVTWIGDILHIT